MVRASTTYRCRHCTQLLPFDALVRVPEACLRRCQGGCDWVEVGPTDPAVRSRASLDGPLGNDGLPAADRAG
ncbi:MAG: hypothetical protein H0V19_01785 [Euzebyales bacterium]|nr:hypothetical protein [Euzebyales bacterium]